VARARAGVSLARWPLLLIPGFVVLLLACVLVFPGLLVDRSLRPGQQLLPAERVKAENDVRTTLLQGVAGLLLLVGATATWRQLRLSREGQITERFTKAIDQLDYAKSLEVRLGAIYALERIARDSERDHWPIMEILTAYVRQHAPWPPKDGEPPEDVAKAHTGSKPAPDIQAILTVLGRRTRTLWHGEVDVLDLRATDLRGANFFGAHLEHARFQVAHLEGANFADAHLEGASLEGAIGLTEEQIRWAIMNPYTKLPDYLPRPPATLFSEKDLRSASRVVKSAAGEEPPT
jgi:Pentapeptide repeats (8 copies)